MRGPEHVSFAVVTTGGALWLMNGQFDLNAYAAAALSAAAVGSLVPDIDHPKAWISNRIPATLMAIGLTGLGLYAYAAWTASRGDDSIGGAMIAPMADFLRPVLGWAWLALALGAALLAISVVVTRALGHRGPTHSLVVGAALTLIATIGFAISPVSWTIGLWFGWGYLSHLLTDMITPKGCPSLLWPAGSASLALRMPRRSTPAVPHATPSPTPSLEQVPADPAPSDQQPPIGM